MFAASGFLLQRKVLPQHADCVSKSCNLPPQLINKAVIILIGIIPPIALPLRSKFWFTVRRFTCLERCTDWLIGPVGNQPMTFEGK
jgi:hypothetical protein